MRIGIYGGSFDPIHIGHLWIGEAAMETLALDELRWIPVAQSPLKGRGPIAADQARLGMLHLALDAVDGHAIDDREIRRGEISYTVDTVGELRSDFPDAEIIMIIGSDSLATMPQWHRPKELLESVIPAVVQRGGEDEIDFSILKDFVSPQRIELFRRHVIAMPVIELSSSEMRERLASGRSIRFRTPRSVEAFIQAENLYRQSE
tara:strand:- start:69259 stop:69873 length:615 start_codon:yes stop_codon:yes gene_type:complete